MIYQRNSSQKTLWAVNLALFLIWIGLLAGIVVYNEKHLPNLKGPSFVRYIFNNHIESRTFTTRDEKVFVPNPELYDPFPELRGLLSVPHEVLLAVRRYEKSCRAVDYEKADAAARALSLSPSKLIDWQRAVCTKNFSNFKVWLDRSPLIHPSGVSYAKLFSQAQVSLFPHDPVSALPETLFHVHERSKLSDFDQWYLGLSNDEQKIYSSGFQIAVIGHELAVAGDWDGSIRKILIIPLSTVTEVLRKNFSLEIAPRGQSMRCEFQQYGLCFARVSEPTLQWKPRWSMTILIGLVGYILTALVFSYLIWHGERLNRESEQALLFQVISHELRTPLTVIQLSTDGLRQQFDYLDPNGQQHFLKMLDGLYEFEKIMTRIFKELKNENEDCVFDLVETTSLVIQKKYSDLVTFHEQEDSVMVKSSIFWYEICLANLIRNALLHGQKPITVSIRKVGQFAQVEVQDAGIASLRDLRSFNRIFVRKPSKLGLGLGLRIVSRKMKEMSGRLIVKESPTRYVLQFNLLENS